MHRTDQSRPAQHLPNSHPTPLAASDRSPSLHRRSHPPGRIAHSAGGRDPTKILGTERQRTQPAESLPDDSTQRSGGQWRDSHDQPRVDPHRSPLATGRKDCTFAERVVELAGAAAKSEDLNLNSVGSQNSRRPPDVRGAASSISASGDTLNRPRDCDIPEVIDWIAFPSLPVALVPWFFRQTYINPR